MNNPLSALSNRTKIALLVTGCIFLIGVALMLFSRETMVPGKGEKTAIQLPTPISENQQEGSVSPVQTTNLAKWKTYTGTGYSFQYSPGWNVQTGPVSGGGEIVVVRPQELPAGINYPQFILQSQPLTKNAQDTKAGVLLGFGFTESDVTVGNTPAKKYSGTMPFKTVGDKNVNEPVKDTTYLISAGETLYVLKYEYEDSLQNEMIEEFFSGFVESFKTGQ